MGQLVYILGRSGTGKSFSLRNFPKDKVAVINIQGKVLPFKGANSIEQTATDDSANILKALDIYAHDYKSIVIDDYQYVMANEFMRRSYERGYDKFTEIGRHAWDIANKVRELPEDVIVYIMCHTDRDDEGNEKIKTIGKLLDEKICLEGMSTIVLKTNVSDGQYSFITQNNGKDTVKSPAGMFPSYAIDNDLWYVDQKIRNYYELGEFKNDEEIAQMDQEAEKAEVAKPDADGRKRRRKATEEPSNQTESGTTDRQGTVSESAPVNEPSADEPKRRHRKPRNETAVNEPQNVETPEEPMTKEEVIQAVVDGKMKTVSTVESVEEKPKRRRRNRLTEADMASTSSDEIENENLPFY